MDHQQRFATVIDAKSEEDSSAAFLAQHYRTALDRLSHSFASGSAFATLIGPGRAASDFVIRRFLSDLDDEVVVVRITEHCADAVKFMASIICELGFEPKDLRLADLESILRMFLSFQKSHGRRTLICIDETQSNDWWVLDKIRGLVELESEGRFGLMVLISGQPDLKKMLYTRPLSAISAEAGNRITLMPFSLSHSEEYLRQRVEAGGTVRLDEVIDYPSIELIHELSGGVLDAISTLVGQCLHMAEEEGGVLVTTDLVRRGYELLQAASAPQRQDAHVATVNLDGLRRRRGRLVVPLTGKDVQELALGQGHVLIGRSKLCDIRLESPTVSRQHALIVCSPTGLTLIDLSSTNGTYVDGYQIEEHELVAGETIGIGDCTIEYVLDDDRQAGYGAAGEIERIGIQP